MIHALIVIILIMGWVVYTSPFFMGVMGIESPTGKYQDWIRYKVGKRVRDKLKGWMD